MRCKIIKQILYVVLTIILAIVLFSCSKKETQSMIDSTKEIYNLDENMANRRVAVVYFSVNDDILAVAEKFKEALNADIIEIVPREEYTEDDLDFNNVDSRVYLEDEFNPFGEENTLPDDEYETVEGLVIATKNELVKKEKKTLKELPAIERINTNKYQIIVLGFPVWYENAPKVIYTFIKDLKNKIIVPFCVGGDMGMIDQYLSNFVDESVMVMSGKSFDKDVRVDIIKKWVTDLSVDFGLKQ